MNILLFGGAGFIGSHFKEHLKANHNVHSFDIIGKDGSVNCDVREEIVLENINFSKNDIIVNLAAIHKMPGHKDYEYFETNVRGALNICSFAEQNGINNIIFTSSIAPYGGTEELKKESSIPMPNTPYGISKLIAEHIQNTWQAKDEKNRKLLILRPGVVYGKGENGNNTRLYKALKSNKFFYPGRKDTIKANIYVKDLVELSMQIFSSYDSGSRLYNFTYEPAYCIEEIVNVMCEVCHLRKPKLIVNGKFLKFLAIIMNLLSAGSLGIHPQRIEKLMKSTNISGRLIIEDGFHFNYNLKSSIEDWYKDCKLDGLF